MNYTKKISAAIIIGGGPAGAQCALWLNRLGHTAIILEKSNQLGGLQQMSPYKNNWIVGIRNQSGQTVAKNIHQHIKEMNIPFHLNTTAQHITRLNNGYFKVDTNTQSFSTHHIVIATGVQPICEVFHSSEKVIIGPGATIENTPLEGKRVAILGGGDNAAENWHFIAEKSPLKCHLYARTLRARPALLAPIPTASISTGIYLACQESMTIQHEGLTQHYDYFVVLYGWEAVIPNALQSFNLQFAKDKNFIHTDSDGNTSTDGILAAGEVVGRMHPCVVTSMASGTIIAKTIQRIIEGSYY